MFKQWALSENTNGDIDAITCTQSQQASLEGYQTSCWRQTIVTVIQKWIITCRKFQRDWQQTSSTRQELETARTVTVQPPIAALVVAARAVTVTILLFNVFVPNFRSTIDIITTYKLVLQLKLEGYYQTRPAASNDLHLREWIITCRKSGVTGIS